MQPCGAKTRNGGTCKTPAMPNGRCRMHGGKSLGGVESATYKHGAYSKYAGHAISEKMEMFPEDEALSLLGELTLMRGLLAAFLEKYGDTGTLMTKSVASITLLVDNIRKITDSMVKQRNDTALTAVELAFIINRLPDIVVKYVDTPDKQQQFLSELFGVVGASQSGDSTLIRITGHSTD